jgi:hypothetical protein
MPRYASLARKHAVKQAFGCESRRRADLERN